MTKNTNSNGLLVNRSGKVRLGVINDMIGTLRAYNSQSLLERPDVTHAQAKETARLLMLEADNGNLARQLTLDEWKLVCSCQ